MAQILLYKGYIGSVNFCDISNIYYGKLLGIEALVSYEGKSKKDLEQDFRGAVDYYLRLCKEDYTTPEAPSQNKIKMKVIHYKGYDGSVNYSVIDNIFYGEVLGIGASVSYEGKHIGELIQDFCDGVDSYLQYCKRNNEEPEEPYQERFRLSLAVQKAATMYAAEHNMSLTEYIEGILHKELGVGDC